MTSVALLRGINIGAKGNRVAMADLRALFGSLGYGEICTLLNSGNVVFTHPAGETDATKRIEAAITERLGLSLRVIVRSAKELDAIIAGNDLGNVVADPARLIVTVVKTAPHRERLEAIRRDVALPDAMSIGEEAVYVYCPDGSLKSVANVAVGAALKTGATARNWSTMLKLQAMCGKE